MADESGGEGYGGGGCETMKYDNIWYTDIAQASLHISVTRN